MKPLSTVLSALRRFNADNIELWERHLYAQRPWLGEHTRTVCADSPTFADSDSECTVRPDRSPSPSSVPHGEAERVRVAVSQRL